MQLTVINTADEMGVLTCHNDIAYTWLDHKPHSVEVWPVGKISQAKFVQWRDVPPEVREAFVRQG